MPYQYVTINVPVGAAPFKTDEDPQTIVGGYIEKMNITYQNGNPVTRPDGQNLFDSSQ